MNWLFSSWDGEGRVGESVSRRTDFQQATRVGQGQAWVCLLGTYCFLAISMRSWMYNSSTANQALSLCDS